MRSLRTIPSIVGPPPLLKGGGGGKPTGVVFQGHADCIHDKLGTITKFTGINEILDLTFNLRS